MSRFVVTEAQLADIEHITSAIMDRANARTKDELESLAYLSRDCRRIEVTEEFHMLYKVNNGKKRVAMNREELDMKFRKFFGRATKNEWVGFKHELLDDIFGKDGEL